MRDYPILLSDDAMLKRLWFDKSVNVGEIAEKLGIGQATVTNRAYRMGLPKRKTATWVNRRAEVHA